MSSVGANWWANLKVGTPAFRRTRDATGTVATADRTTRSSSSGEYGSGSEMRVTLRYLYAAVPHHVAHFLKTLGPAPDA